MLFYHPTEVTPVQYCAIHDNRPVINAIIKMLLFLYYKAQVFLSTPCSKQTLNCRSLCFDDYHGMQQHEITIPFYTAAARTYMVICHIYGEIISPLSNIPRADCQTKVLAHGNKTK